MVYIGDLPEFKKIWQLEILTWESIGKHKLWNISKTVDRRAKRTKIWDLGYHSAYMYGTLMPDSLSLVWGYLVYFCKISDSTIFETLFL